ncbi:MAG: hypothetical protein K8R69_00215 [Deltaproteobacteria bacterium]|nr:hypothetical protein [Deltaproteobacteria bacterium]
MLWSLKSLVENQMKLLSRKTTGLQNPTWQPSTADVRNQAYAMTSVFQSLENGGSRHVAASGWVAAQEIPSEYSETIPRPIADSDEDNLRRCENFFSEIGISSAAGIQLPEQNPLTLRNIDWDREISQQALEQFSRDSTRQAKAETLSQDAKINRLVQVMLLALRSGNISLAMLLFSHIETTTANEVTRCLMTKVQNLQDNKRKLSLDLQNQKTDPEGTKNMQKINADMQQANDDITVLQTFIRDVAQNKQASIELASAFLSNEHETTMAIVRSFGR